MLRRHVAGNLAAFLRWYSDPEVARLDPLPGRPDAARGDRAVLRGWLLGTSRCAGDPRARPNRLIGTCAFSQLDAENGSALYHITIGEKDAWGHGYGTEATRLMLDHAFETLGLHRIGLSVFAFNERAIRAYLSCGFVIEGRAREAIWRDGRWWDEVTMSVLESDWRDAGARRPCAGGDGGGRRALGRSPTLGRRR